MLLSQRTLVQFSAPILGSSQPSIIPVLRDPMPFSGLQMDVYVHMCTSVTSHTHKEMGKTPLVTKLPTHSIAMPVAIAIMAVGPQSPSPRLYPCILG